MRAGCRKIELIIIAIAALTAGNVVAICPVGDLDGNCEIGFEDLALFSEQWLASTAGSADMTGDEEVDMSDLSILAGNWRQVNLPLVINEVMASNTKTVKDPQGEYDDWIELFNAGDYAINVGGMYLTDEPNNDGDDILLFNRDARTLIDGFNFIDQRADISYGRYPDGDRDLRYMAFPTSTAANNGAYTDNVADTKFSHDRGFYDASFSLTISTASQEATIRYTTDGTAPTPTSGLIYTRAIPISTTTCIRAIAYKPGWLETNVDTHTYIFPRDVIRQPANIPGYPNPWTWLGSNKYAYHD